MARRVRHVEKPGCFWEFLGCSFGVISGAGDPATTWLGLLGRWLDYQQPLQPAYAFTEATHVGYIPEPESLLLVRKDCRRKPFGKGLTVLLVLAFLGMAVKSVVGDVTHYRKGARLQELHETVSAFEPKAELGFGPYGYEEEHVLLHNAPMVMKTDRSYGYYGIGVFEASQAELVSHVRSLQMMEKAIEALRAKDVVCRLQIELNGYADKAVNPANIGTYGGTHGPLTLTVDYGNGPVVERFTKGMTLSNRQLAALRCAALIHMLARSGYAIGTDNVIIKAHEEKVRSPAYRKVEMTIHLIEV